MLVVHADEEFQADAGESGGKPYPRVGGAQQDGYADRGDHGGFPFKAVKQGLARALVQDGRADCLREHRAGKGEGERARIGAEAAGCV